MPIQTISAASQAQHQGRTPAKPKKPKPAPPNSQRKVSSVKLPTSADYMGQANDIVGGQIGQQVAANNTGRLSARDAYAKMIAQLKDQFSQSKNAVNSQAVEDRARLNQTMAARGTSYGPDAGVEFGRFDSAVQGKVGELAQNYQTQGAAATDTLASRLQAIAETERALRAGAPGQAMSIAQALASQEMQRQKMIFDMQQTEAQAAQQPTRNANGLTPAEQFAFDHRFDTNPNEPTKNDMYNQANQQAVWQDIAAFQAEGHKTMFPSQFIQMLQSKYGIDVSQNPTMLNMIQHPLGQQPASGNQFNPFGAAAWAAPQWGSRILSGLGGMYGGAPGMFAASQVTPTGRQNVIDLYNGMKNNLGNLFK